MTKLLITMLLSLIIPTVADAPIRPISVSLPTLFQIRAATKVVASWYGRSFHNAKTASGAKFSKFGLSAAHRTLPFHTILHLRNPSNNREVKVIILDRGPFILTRDLDVSQQAAWKLGYMSQGIASIEIISITLPNN